MSTSKRLYLFLNSELLFLERGQFDIIASRALEFLLDAALQMGMPCVEFADTRFGGHMCLPCYVKGMIEPPVQGRHQWAIHASGPQSVMTVKSRLIVGLSGASGVIYGLRALDALGELSIERHLVASKAAEMTLGYETGLKPSTLRARAEHVYKMPDVGAPIASGSFRTLGMLITPCSVRTMSEIATGVTSSLLTRAADVVLKERGRLVLMVRETPFHLGHLRTMAQLTEMGAVIMPPLPAFYAHPQSVGDIVDQSVGRALDLFGLDWAPTRRWGEDIAEGRRPGAATGHGD